MAGSSHGHTPAAWTGVTIAFIGFCISAAFMVLASPLGVWAGLAVVVLAAVVSKAMSAAGLGAPKESDDSLRARVEAGQVGAR